MIERISDYKDCILISPKVIRGGVRLITDYKSLELYKNIDKNTLKFLETITSNLLTSRKFDEKIEEHLKFKLFFMGEHDEILKSKKSFFDFIIENKNKIILSYSFVTGYEVKSYFCDYMHEEKIANSDYILLDFNKFLEILEKKGFEFRLDTCEDKLLPSTYRDDDITKIIVSHSYNKKNKLDGEKQLIRKRKIK